MGTALFYHLTRRPMEQTLMMLLGKAQGAGLRVVVRGTDLGRIGWLDEKLWLGGDESFLPHGLAGGPHDGLQPILLTTAQEVPNAAACLMSVDGAEVQADEVAQMQRTCVLFDGNDAQAVQVARDQWKRLTGAGAAAQYWSEESGRWEMKAESAGAVA